MEQEPPRDAKGQTDPPIKPAIPPPDLSRPAPPPPSPMESMPRSSSPPPLSSAGNSGAKVNLRSSDDDDDSLAGGAVPFNTRAIAAVIDCVVAVGLVIGLRFLLPGFFHRIADLSGIAYMVTRDSLPFLGGQSVGKKAMKIKAVTLEGKSLVGNWETALIRNGVLIIPFFGLVELFILLTREDKPERGRRLGDEWAKTKVIIEEKPADPESGDADSGPPPVV